MKFPLLFLSTLFAASLYAQEAGKADPPAKVAPPAKAVEKTDSSQVNPPKARSRYVPEPSKPRTASGVRRGSVPSRRVVLPPKASNSKPAVQRVPQVRAANSPNRPAVAPPKGGALTENITIHLQGSVEGGPNLDLSMTGIGPIFRGDVVVGDDPAIVTHSYSVTLVEGGYQVEYSIGQRLKMEQKVDGRSTGVEFRDVMVSGTAIAKEGKKLVISKNGERELGLTLTKTVSK